MCMNTSSNSPTLGESSASPPDEQATHLYAKYYSAIFRRIYSLIRNQERAEELTQDTFLKAWRALPSRRPGSISGWLFQIALNKDHIADGQRVRTADRTVELCKQLGFVFVARHQRRLPQLSFWQRRRKEQGLPVVEEEDVLVFRRSIDPIQREVQ